jgi:hypothetical protein
MWTRSSIGRSARTLHSVITGRSSKSGPNPASPRKIRPGSGTSEHPRSTPDRRPAYAEVRDVSHQAGRLSAALVVTAGAVGGEHVPVSGGRSRCGRRARGMPGRTRDARVGVLDLVDMVAVGTGVATAFVVDRALLREREAETVDAAGRTAQVRVFFWPIAGPCRCAARDEQARRERPRLPRPPERAPRVESVRLDRLASRGPRSQRTSRGRCADLDGPGAAPGARQSPLFVAGTRSEIMIRCTILPMIVRCGK